MSRAGSTGHATAAALGLALLGGCVSREVHVTSAPGVSVARYHSFGLGAPGEVPNGFRSTPESADALRRTSPVVTQALAARGYRLASSDPPDLLVQCASGRRTRTQLVTSATGSGGTDSGMKTFTESELSIDVFERASGRRVWHGDAVEEVESGRASDAALRDTVDAILHSFPRAAGSGGT